MTPYQLRVEVRWEARDRELVWAVTVPPGTSAELTLPGGATRTLGPGRYDGTAAG
jgi:hypothetical protein